MEPGNRDSRFSFLIPLLAICCGALLVVIYFQEKPTSYLDFIRRDRSYYLQVARACEELRNQALTQQSNGWLKADDPSFSSLIPSVPKLVRLVGSNSYFLNADQDCIPKIIRRLHPQYVEAGRFFVRAPIPYARWGIAWEKDSDGGNEWRLWASGEGVSKIVLTTTNLDAEK